MDRFAALLLSDCGSRGHLCACAGDREQPEVRAAAGLGPHSPAALLHRARARAQARGQAQEGIPQHFVDTFLAAKTAQMNKS